MQRPRRPPAASHARTVVAWAVMASAILSMVSGIVGEAFAGVPEVRLDRVEVRTPPIVRYYVTRFDDTGRALPPDPTQTFTVVVNATEEEGPFRALGTSADEPVAAVIVLPLTEQLRTSLDALKRAADRLMRGLPANSKIGVLGYSDVVVGTEAGLVDRARASATLATLSVRAQGDIDLTQAVSEGLGRLRGRELPPRKLLLVLSDGFGSVVELDDFRQLGDQAGEDDTRVHTIALVTELTEINPAYAQALSELSRRTGSFRKTTIGPDLEAAAAGLAEEIGNQQVFEASLPQYFRGKPVDFAVKAAGVAKPSELKLVVLPEHRDGHLSVVLMLVLAAILLALSIYLLLRRQHVKTQEAAAALARLRNPSADARPEEDKEEGPPDIYAKTQLLESIPARGASRRPTTTTHQESSAARPATTPSAPGKSASPFAPEPTPSALGESAKRTAHAGHDEDAPTIQLQSIRAQPSVSARPQGLGEGAGELETTPPGPAEPPGAPVPGVLPGPTEFLKRVRQSGQPPGKDEPRGPSRSGSRSEPRSKLRDEARDEPRSDLRSDVRGDLRPDVRSGQRSEQRSEPRGERRAQADEERPAPVSMPAVPHKKVWEGWVRGPTMLMTLDDLGRTERPAWIVPLEGRFETLPLRSGTTIGPRGSSFEARAELHRPTEARFETGLDGRWRIVLGNEAPRSITEGEHFFVGATEFVFLEATHPQDTDSGAMLVIVGGVDEGRRIPLRDGRNVCLGSDPSCDVVLRGEGVASRHLGVRLEGHICQVADLGSDGRVLDREMRPIGARSLHDQDEVRIGSVRVVFRWFGEAEAAS